MTDAENTKITPNFLCNFCNTVCSRQSEWNRHIATRKHKTREKYLQISPISPISPTDANDLYNAANIICDCGKKYKHRQSLFNHKKKCTYVIADDAELTNELMTESIESNGESRVFTETETVGERPQPVLATISNDMIFNLINQNQELQKQLIELSSQAKTVNNTTNNTMNNQFNLNVFLKEDCKDALNMVDFVESLKLTVQDLEQTGKLGYVDGITRIFIQALKRLDVNMRPLHCTDIKREIIYIKEQDNWEKENDHKTKLRNVVARIARKNLRMMPLWQAQNPNCIILDTNENNSFIKISLSALGPASSEDLAKQEDKIIRNVLKEVVLEKNKRMSLGYVK